MDRKELREGATKIPEETAIAKYFPAGRNQFAFVIARLPGKSCLANRHSSAEGNTTICGKRSEENVMTQKVIDVVGVSKESFAKAAERR